jgi:hypothetical protein
VRPHWLNALAATVNSLTVCTQIEHFVMAITITAGRGPHSGARLWATREAAMPRIYRIGTADAREWSVMGRRRDRFQTPVRTRNIRSNRSPAIDTLSKIVTSSSSFKMTSAERSCPDFPLNRYSVSRN